MLHLKIDKI